jgi:hypothetical protein
LAVPSADARYFPGSVIRAIGVEFVQRNGLFLPASVAREPQPIDLVGAYLTFEEIFGRQAGLAYVREALGLVGRDPFIRSCAELLGRYEAPDADRRQVDEALLEATFRQPARGRVLGLLRSGNRALITPQSLLLLIQLALLHSPATPAGAAEPKPFIAVVLALQDGLGDRDGDGGARSEDDTRNVFRGESDAPLFRAIIANQAFAKWPDARILIARHHLHWEQLPAEARERPGRVDLKALFEQATGVSKEDFQAVGTALWGHLQVHGQYPVPGTVFDQFSIARERIEAALDLFVATPDRLRSQITSLEERFRTEWSFDVLRRFPVMRMDDGSFLVLSRRLLLERIFGWVPIYDLTAGLVERGRAGDASRALNWFRGMCELDARQGLETLAPATSAGIRLYGETAIQTAFPVGRNADAVIDYADAWVVVEISTRKVTRATTIALDPQALADDLRIGVEAKVEQLDATIRHLIEDESRLTGQPVRQRRRYVAVLLMTEGFPANPMTMLAIRERLAARGLLRDPRIGPLHIVDQEEMALVEGIVEGGGPGLLALLEGHEGSALHDMGLGDYLVFEHGRAAGLSYARRLDAPFDAAWAPALHRLGEAQAGSADDTEQG